MPAIVGLRLRFPDPRTVDCEGLVAIGGDLSAPRGCGWRIAVGFFRGQ